MATHLALAKVEFEYAAQTDDELSVYEDQLVFVLEDNDPDWHKVKVKNPDPTAAPETGLVPASYLVPVPAVRTTTALYDYAPARHESTGELENDEEMEVAEGEQLDLLEEDGDWVLCRRTDGRKGVGFVPATYVEGGAGADEAAVGADEYTPEAETYAEQPEEEEEQEDYSAAGYAAPAVAAAAVGAGVGAAAVAGDIKTWSVTMLDAKKKKKKGTLGVGNGALFFASESDKTPVQQYPLSALTDVTTEKHKHLHLTFSSADSELHFVIGDKSTFDEIVAKIDEGRGEGTSGAAPAGVPPPPSLPGANGANGAPAPPPPPPPPAPPVPSVGSAYVPPPPPLRAAAGTTALPPPPIRSAMTPATPTPPPAAPSPPPVARVVPAPPAPAQAQQGNAVALYDFESQGDDELSVAEGERVIFIPGGSDDAEWAKVRRLTGGEEGVVPVSYIEVDEGAEMTAPPPPPPPAPAAPAPPPIRSAPASSIPVPPPPPIRSASNNTRAREDAEDAEVLRAQLEADARSQREREKRAEKERRAERERRDRLRAQPSARPIPVPATRDELPSEDDEVAPPPPLAARPGKSSSGSADKKREIKKPNAARTRVWKDRTGQFKVEAEFLGLNGQKIRLHKVNGVIIEVPLEKMSQEDTNFIRQLQSGRDGHSSRPSSARREDSDARRERRADRDARHASRSEAVKGVVTVTKPTSLSGAPKRRSDFDWFDFFLQAGCDMDNCTRYARNADNEGFDEALIPDLEDSNLRGLGLKEGDVIRVKRHIKDKFRKPPPTPSKDSSSTAVTAERQAQIDADHELAQKLSRGEPLPPAAPQLFSSGPEGTLKPRRGRRNTAASATGVNSNALTAAASELEKSRSSPAAAAAAPRVPSPSEPESHKRSSSTVPVHGGFDDDAWDIKPSSASKAASPSPAPAAPKAPSPPPPPAAPPIPVAAASPPPTKPAEPARTDSGQTLTYNDGLLAQLGVGSARASPAPQVPQQTGAASAFLTPQGTGYNPAAPRGPIAPVPANQGLLAPLQPMRTGVPVAQLQPQNTGFFPGATTIGVMPMQTGYSGMMSQPTGFTGMAATMPMGMQPTGFVPQPTGFAPQATGFAPQSTGFAPQPTGFVPQATGFGGGAFGVQPTGFAGGQPGYMQSQATGFAQPPQQQQQPIQFNPLPPSSHAQSTTVASSAATHNAPGNVFAAMKDGTFAAGKTHLPPQDSGRYDALRAQPTGFAQPPPPPQQQQMGMGMNGMGGMGGMALGGMGMGGMGMPMGQMPQMTGFMPPQQQQQQQYGFQQY